MSNTKPDFSPIVFVGADGHRYLRRWLDGSSAIDTLLADEDVQPSQEIIEDAPTLTDDSANHSEIETPTEQITQEPGDTEDASN